MKRSPAIFLAVALAVSACSSDDPTTTPSSDPTTPPSSVTSTALTTTPSTTAIPTTTAPSTTGPSSTAAVTTTEPPATVTNQAPTTAPVGETDWRVVLEALGRRRQELYSNPDVSRIGEVCGDGTPCAEQLEVQLGDMASKGWHVEGGDPYTVLEARLEEFTGDSLDEAQVVTIVAIVQRPSDAGQIVDSAGAVVADVAAETPEGVNTENRTILGRVGPDGTEWRILDQVRLREVPG